MSRAASAIGRPSPAPGADRLNGLIGAAVAAFQRGQPADAERHARRLTKKAPNHPAGWKLLGAALQAQNRADDALCAFEACTRLSPRDPEAHFGLAVALQWAGRPEEAVAAYDSAIRLDPTSAEAHCNRARTLLDRGRPEEALAGFRLALRYKPDFALAHHGCGSAMLAAGRDEDALVAYDAALRLKPDLTRARQERGIALLRLGRLAEALANFEEILRLDPDNAEAHNNRAGLLRMTDRLAEALAGYDRALRLKPDYALAHGGRGDILSALGRYDEAVAAYDEALRLEPRAAGIWKNRGQGLDDLGDAAAAIASYRRALLLRPDQLGWEARIAFTLPGLVADRAEIGAIRDRLAADIARLSARRAVVENPVDDVGKTFFYLAYHGLDDRPLLEAAAGLLRRKSPVLDRPVDGVDGHAGPRGRIRVGFLSEHLCGHTIGKLMQGLLHQLDRERFHVTLLHAGRTKRDHLRAILDGVADRTIELPRELPAAQRLVAEQGLDVLYYPDIGMSPFTYYLAYSRLAPVQAVGWGHPDTTGLDTIDYFLSPGAAEPEGAERHYTETLIRLSRLPSYYEPFLTPARIPPRSRLGLPEDATLYGCPQSLFKCHPDFDAVLAEIAERDRTARFVFVDTWRRSWRTLLQNRWSRSCPALNERVVWLPPQGPTRFMTMLACMDVMLDPVHFGSGNTFYEAMVYGIPYVTWPGGFMRGRLVAAAYRQLGVTGAPVAATIADYAGVAAALGTDADRREACKRELLAKAPALYRDVRAVREFEAFLEASVAAAAAGRKLPNDWRWSDA